MMGVSGSQSVLGITSPNDREQLQRLLARTPATHLDSVEAQLQQLRDWLREAEEVQARVDEIAAKTEQQLSCGRIRALTGPVLGPTGTDRSPGSSRDGVDHGRLRVSQE